MTLYNQGNVPGIWQGVNDLSINKKTVLKKWLGLWILTILILASGCTSKKHQRTIGLVLPNLHNPFFSRLQQGAENTADKAGYQLITLDADNDPAKAVNLVHKLVAQGVKLIIINPIDPAIIAKAIRYADRHSIKIITLDRRLNRQHVLTQITSNNFKGAEIAANYLKEKLQGQGNIIELQGNLTSSVTKARTAGFNAGIQNTDIRVVARKSAYFSQKKAFILTSKLLRQHPNIVAVFAQNDEMALGAVKALANVGKHKVLVIGFDGIPKAIEAVRLGKMSATIAQQPYLMGQLAVENAIKTMTGEPVDKAITVPFRLVTKFNI